ncbi:hypothetical protein TELCIR_17519 [Teladorsagia circumcincta]|uniref:Uncharacterized protein n=1 Tax=Teladorsagia circumcincta TaxID=45464 RepID=A0A2G9TU23_TELCI|nr:hypothetical protein TELCIR_17519 [Teladorsagia circumcincta]
MSTTSSLKHQLERPPLCPEKMSDNNEPEEVQEEEVTPDYTKYDEDSVPPPEKEIKHVHPGRPDLDYEDTPVGPAPEE